MACAERSLLKVDLGLFQMNYRALEFNNQRVHQIIALALCAQKY